MKLSVLSAACAIALSCGVSGASAATVSAVVPAGFVDFSDNSAERLIDRNNNGLLDVGDSLRGILSIDNVTGSNGVQIGLGGTSGNDELTGLFQVVVLSKTAIGNGRFNYTFGYDATAGFAAGVIGTLYDDPANNFARIGCASFAACEATASGGAVWATVSLAGGFWSASNAVDNPSLGATLPLNTPLGTFGMGLHIETNNTGFQWNQVQCVDTTDLSVHLVDFCGQGGILASGRSAANPTNTVYDIFDNVDLTANRVPEPGSMALVGIALLGLGLSARRKKAA